MLTLGCRSSAVRRSAARGRLPRVRWHCCSNFDPRALLMLLLMLLLLMLLLLMLLLMLLLLLLLLPPR